MSDAQPFYKPRDATDLKPIRPLLGMYRDLAPQAIPYGGNYTVSNFIVQPMGLLRRWAYTLQAASQQIVIGDWIDIAYMRDTSGTVNQFLITTNFIYQITPSGFVIMPWLYTTGTVAVSGTAVTGSGTAWTTTVQGATNATAGDYMSFGTSATMYKIASVDSATGITLATGAGTVIAGTAYKVYKSLNASFPYLVDWFVANQHLIFVSRGAVPLYWTTGATSLSPWITRFPGSYNDGTVTCAGTTTVTGTNTLWVTSGLVSSGGTIEFNHDGTQHTIATVNSDTQITLTAAGPTYTGVSYIIFPSSGVTYIRATCGISYQGYVFLANTLDNIDGTKTTRIYFSTQLDMRDFSYPTNYLDLPQFSGEIRRLKRLGNALLIYLDIAVIVALPTNMPEAPLDTTTVLETNGNGLIGMKAVTSGINCHYAVFQDDIYMVTLQGVVPLDMAVRQDTIVKCQQLWRVYAATDPNTFRAVFGFPTTSNYMDNLWSYEYRTRQWSVEPTSTLMIASTLSDASVVWSDASLNVYWNDATMDVTWSSFGSIPSLRTFYVENGYYLWATSSGATADPTTASVEGIIETADMDFDLPNTLKFFRRLSARVRSVPDHSGLITFTTQYSVNGGISWRPAGTLRIRDGYDEGYVNFLATGSQIRFRLTTDSVMTPYWLTELVVRSALVGQEGGLGAQK